MGSAEHVHIDPPEVRRNAGQLRLRADEADEIGGEVARALFRADLISRAPSALAEIDEELRLLAEILVRRANLADGYRLPDLAYRSNQIEMLWSSLVDDDGASAIVAGDNALVLLQRHSDAIDANGDGLLTLTELRKAAADQSQPALAAAATALLANHSTLDALHRTTETELFYTGPEPAISGSALTKLLVTNEQLRHDAVVAATALAQGDTSVEIDGVTHDATDIVAAAINNRVFAHDAGSAQTFLARLPNAAEGVPGLSIFAVDTTGVESLYDAAMTDVSADDLFTRFRIVSQMPETRDGVRNERITELYALGSTALDAMVNPNQVGDPSLPGHGGANWLTWGTGASDTINGGITGETKAYDFIPPTDTAKQMMADGNQLIATTILGHYFEFIATFGDGEVTEENVEEFFNGFQDGQGDLQIALTRQLAAMEADDPALKQLLQLESNVAVTAYEQAIVDDTLDFNKLEWEAQVGSHLLTGALSLVSGAVPSTKSASETFTEQGSLNLAGPDGDVVEIELDAPIPPGSQDNNLVADFDPTDESNPSTYRIDDVELPGIESVNPVARIDETTELSIDYDDWDHSPTAASDWTNYHDRMPHIIELMHQHHVSSLAFDSVNAVLDR